MGSEELNDPISVLAKFDKGVIQPVIVRWRGRRYWVQKLNLHHTARQGRDLLHYFAVTTEVGDCTLTYSQDELRWTLLETHFTG